MNRRTTFLAVTVAVLLVSLSWVKTHATYAGRNGKIAFVSYREGKNAEIYTMNSNGTDVTRLTVHPDSDSDPDWSPDGRMIAFTRLHDFMTWGIYVMDANGTNVRRLVEGPMTLEYDGYYGGPRWSPDGTKIAYTAGHLDGNSDIYVMYADGTHQVQLTNNPGTDTGPSWSPDGSQIAFTSERTSDGNSAIYIMNADGSNQTAIAETNDYGPAWSPDGTKIVFFSERTRYQADIYLMDPDGGNQQQLTSTGLVAETGPTWSPDGTQIAYMASRGSGQLDIYRMNSDGSGIVRLTSYKGFDAQPAWQAMPPDTYSFLPTNDAYVVSSSPNGVYNRKTLNIRDTAADMNAYVKFNVVGLSGTVQKATLRLYVKDPGPDGGKVSATSPYYAGTTTQWLETGLKWKNAPLIGGSPVAAIGKTLANRWVEVDVTQAVIDGIANQNGRVSLAIANDSTNLVTYSSKEGTRPPELVVVTAP